MSRTRRALLVALALLGWMVALALSDAIVQLRYRWADPAAVAGSPGMWAFGDLIATLALAGVLSLPGTWALFRAVRDLDGFWRLVSWGGLVWAGGAPAAIAVRIVGPFSRPAPGAPMPLSAGALADVFGVLRLLVSPASLPALAIAAWACVHPPSTRRLRWAVALELVGLVLGVLLLGWGLHRARS